MNEDFFNYRQRENIRAICFALALIMLFVGFAWCAIRTESLKRQLEQKPNSTAPGKTDSVTADTLVVSNAEKEQDRLYPMPARNAYTFDLRNGRDYLCAGAAYEQPVPSHIRQNR